MKEIPTHRCRTAQLAIDMDMYAEFPSYADGRKLNYWEAHPEHWYYKCLEGLVCTNLNTRPMTMCEDCNRRQWAWQKEWSAERRRKALAKKLGESEAGMQSGRNGGRQW